MNKGLGMQSRLAAFAAAFAVTLTADAHAANLPANFTGFWLATEATNNACRKDDIKGEKNNIPIARVMSVAAGTVTYYETRCKLLSVKSSKSNDKNQASAEVELSCSGEGMTWRAREIWHVATIDGKKVAVVTGLSQTDTRDERGRKQPNTPDGVTTAIYFECK